MAHLKIDLLGPFEVTRDGEPVTGFAYAKVRALLAYLAVETGQAHTRAALATLLWPDQPERKARASLSQALLTLRHALEGPDPTAPTLLVDTNQIGLNPAAAVAIDVGQFLAGLAATEGHAHRSWRTCGVCAERLRQAVGLYRGLLLADLAIADSEVFEEWLVVQREYLRQRTLTALERLVEWAAWRGPTPAALGYAQQLVAIDPLLEGSRRALMRLLALNGETGAALAQYRQLAALLDQELGAEPEEATTALYEQIRRGALGELGQPPPPFVVPQPPTALVGRPDELQTLCARLREGRGSLLTLIGTGGIGKTRLALEAAHALRYDFEDGVYFVELAPLSDPDQLANTIARALGVAETPARTIGESLRAALRTRHLLLVLDNFEHVVAAAPFLAELLAECPALTLLATSRSPLGLRAEQQLLVEPLVAAEAVALFVQRAAAVGASLAEDEASAAVYGAICGRLDRLPLAIELIAVRARTLAPGELLHQLEQPLKALPPGPRDSSPRHRSLRHAIQWSYDLLEPEERRVFRAIGVFKGGCTVEAVRAVLGDAEELLAPLEALVRASLLRRQTVAGQTRFYALETIREFALEQLAAASELEALQGRHGAYYAGFATAASVELLRAEASRWRGLVSAEHDNLRAAFSWLLAHNSHEAALQLAAGIWRFYFWLGSLREGLERLEAALAYGEQASLDVQCQALRAAGVLAGGLSEYPRARRWFEAARDVAWRLGDQSALQSIMNNLGSVLLQQGELDEARIQLEVSLSLARRSADPSVAKFPLGILAGLLHRLGEDEQAQLLSEEGLRLNRERQDPEGIADAMRTLATIVHARGDLERARQLAEGALEQHRLLGHQLGTGLDLAALGDIDRARGDYGAALDRYQECLSLWQERGNTVNSAAVLDRVAHTLALTGAQARAVTLSAAAAAIREQAQVGLAKLEQLAFEQTLEACRHDLGAAAFGAALAAGRTLTLSQAIALALEPAARAVV